MFRSVVRCTHTSVSNYKCATLTHLNLSKARDHGAYTYESEHNENVELAAVE